MNRNPENDNTISPAPCPVPGVLRFAHEAMATNFEIFILHPDSEYARQGAHAAFTELDAIEAQLSRFVENSDISRINNLPANQPLQIGIETFECLQLCAQLYIDTNGAFDITAGTLKDCWLAEDNPPRTPSQGQLEHALAHTGMHLLEFDRQNYAVRLQIDSMVLDLGGFGKGYAVAKMADSLREWSIETALFHGGTSSVFAMEPPPDTKGWPVTLSSPLNREQIIARLRLNNNALSSSGLQQGPHIIDPRSGKPVTGKHAAWVSTTDPATADALTTAFMVMTTEQIEQYCTKHTDTKAMILLDTHGASTSETDLCRFGLWKELDRD